MFYDIDTSYVSGPSEGPPSELLTHRLSVSPLPLFPLRPFPRDVLVNGSTPGRIVHSSTSPVTLLPVEFWSDLSRVQSSILGTNFFGSYREKMTLQFSPNPLPPPVHVSEYGY